MTRPRRDGFYGGTPLLLIAAIALLYFARSVFIPLALALTLTFLLTPAVTRLQMLGLGRTVAVALVMSVSLAAMGGMAWMLGNQVLLVINGLPNYSDNIRAKIAAIRRPPGGSLGGAAKAVEQITQEISKVDAPPESPQRSVRDTAPTPVRVIETPASTMAYLRALMLPALKPLGVVTMVLIFTVFMLIFREDLRNRLFRLAGLARLNVMTQALDDAAQRISRYLWMQILVNGIFGVLIGTGLFFIGIPTPALWGVVAALGRMIPYVGAPLAGSLPFILSLAVFNSWWPPLLVFLLFAVLELGTSQFLEPWLYGTHTGIAPLALLVTTIFWTMLWGWAGLLLSTPLTVCLIVMGRYVPQMSFVHVLLGDEDVLAVEAQFYQRLLAMDQQEARAIAEKALAEQSLVQFYDTVMIPGLILAEQDRHKGRLDEERVSFLFLSARELVAELSAADSGDHAAFGPAESIGKHVTCVAANDQADEIVALMLAQALERAGVRAKAVPPNANPERLLARLSQPYWDAFCISAVPPFAFAPARALCGTIRSRFPNAKIVIGIWGANGEAPNMLERFARAGADSVATTVEQALDQLLGREQPLEKAKQEPLVPTSA
ncbi:MAG TPA: AI-2E family transporter [Bryobacteraceae bacterium]|nr:AI-2E family transporter [Bryobacteraceae bacterium]